MAQTPSAKPIELDCPCCGTKLVIDTHLGVVLRHEEPVRKPAVEDFAAAARALKGQAAQREEAFQKSFQQQKNQSEILSRKFDELFKKAKEDDPTKPPPKPLGLD
jgi:hypothetical protein